MAEIIKLDELVPEDIIFVYQGKEYTVPGDLDTETVFRIFKHLRAVLELRETREADGSIPGEDEIKRAAKSLHDLLLDIFKVRDPDLESLPFGAKSLPIVTEAVLSRLGVGQEMLVEEGPVPTARASRSPKKSSPASAPRRRSAKS